MGRFISALRRAVLAGVCVLVAACGSLGAPAPQRVAYDLGPLTLPVPQQGVPPLARVRVDAPSWLQGTAMSYRLMYAEPARRQQFRDSYWAAPVGELLQRHFSRAFVERAPAAGGKCVLQLVLDEFGLEFSSPDQGDAVILGRLAVVAGDNAQVLARQDITLREPLQGVGAGAGVEAQRRLLQRLLEEGSGWLAGVDRAGGQGFNTGSYCR